MNSTVGMGGLVSFIQTLKQNVNNVMTSENIINYTQSINYSIYDSELGLFKKDNNIFWLDNNFISAF